MRASHRRELVRIALCSALVFAPTAGARGQGGPSLVPETIPVAAALEGLHAVLGGLDLNELSSTAALEWTGSYTSTAAALAVTGVYNGLPLSLRYAGAFEGTFGVTDLTWTGNWVGALGSDPIAATDGSIWRLAPGGGGYAEMDFDLRGQVGVPPVGSVVQPFASTLGPEFAAPLGIRTFLRWLVRGAELYAEIRLPSGAVVIEAASQLLNEIIGEDPAQPPPERPTDPDSMPPRPTNPRRVEERLRLTWQEQGRGGGGQKDDIAARYDLRSTFVASGGRLTGASVLTPVPEPATVALVGVGVTVLGCALARRRRT